MSGPDTGGPPGGPGIRGWLRHLLAAVTYRLRRSIP